MRTKTSETIMIRAKVSVKRTSSHTQELNLLFHGNKYTVSELPVVRNHINIHLKTRTGVEKP